MVAEILFAMKGPNMESVEFQLNGGHSLPATLFINLMTEKCQVINKHLRSTETNLRITASVNGTQASIKFHDINYEDSELCHIILYNQPDIKDHLIYLWTETRDLLRYYHIDDHQAELDSIDIFLVTWNMICWCKQISWIFNILTFMSFI